MSSKVELLLTTIDQAFDCASWHGTNLRGSLRRVNEVQALFRPNPDRKCIWEIVLHAAYWKYTVRRRIANEKRGSFALKGSDWFTPASTTKQDWKRAVALLVETHREMRAVIERIDDGQLAKRINNSQVTYQFLITGVAAHDLYHAGQIQLLKKLQT